MTKTEKSEERRTAPLATPSDIKQQSVTHISAGLNALLADVFTLPEGKNFHWHMSGPHFRDYHLMLDDHGTQLFAMTDDIAERVRKIGGQTIRSIGHIARLQCVGTTMQHTSLRRTCWVSCARMRKHWWSACLPFTQFATMPATWPRQA